MNIIAENQNWEARDVKTECGAQGDAAAILLPVVKIGDEWYAFTNPKQRGKYVGDYICLTGGSHPYGNTNSECVEVKFYWETFNAGGGRVTAGNSGFFQIPKGEVEVSRVTEFY